MLTFRNTLQHFQRIQSRLMTQFLAGRSLNSFGPRKSNFGNHCATWMNAIWAEAARGEELPVTVIEPLFLRPPRTPTDVF